jgi:hypothetical protein
MADLRETIESYVKRVKEFAQHVEGNEQATKQSLIAPFFTMLGYDLTDPRECLPEYKADFGHGRSAKPVDWAFKHNGAFAFFVEAKASGRRLAGFDEQLADYFSKDTSVKLGILTNGAQWRFFTDVVNANVMDREPFAKWDILADEALPLDVLTLLQKSQFNPELIRAYAQRQRAQSLLVSQLNTLLEPSEAFTRLAVENIETRKMTQGVVAEWKPIVANAINEWARQRTLSAVLAPPAPVQSDGNGQAVTTPEELAAFETVRSLLGSDRRVAYEDSVAYFKLHVADKRTWVFARLMLNKKSLSISVPLSLDQTTPVCRGLSAAFSYGWTTIKLDSLSQIGELGDLFRLAYDSVK